jgi:quinol monooxygenase YgiN
MATRRGTYYTSARWNVRAGRENEFLKIWKRFANLTLKRKMGMTDALLLREVDDPSRFTSLWSWKDLDSIGGWRRTPEYRKYLAELKELCEEIQIRTLQSVANVGGR